MRRISQNNTTTHTRSDMKDKDKPARNKIFLRTRRARIKWIFEVPFFALGSIILVALVWRIFTDIENNHWLDMLLGTDNKLETIKLLGTVIGAMAIIWNGYAFTRRATAQENTAKVAQQDVERQIYNDAVGMLDNTHSASVRIAGAYGLANFAASHKEWKQNICNILCAHVRETTQQPAYQEVYKDKPSNEIQSLLDVLTKRGIFVNERLDFSRAYLSVAKLSGSNLSGANLSEANLRKANLSEANLRKANLSEANLSGTHLSEANLSGTHLWEANLSGAYLLSTNLWGANLSGANLSGAYLLLANLSGADLSAANLSGTDLSGANLSGAYLLLANLSGANITNANLRGAYIHGADLQGAELNGAQLYGAYSTTPTHFFSDKPFREPINSRRGKETDLSGAKNVPANIDEIADTGILTDKMADKIIKEYDKAIKESGE